MQIRSPEGQIKTCQFADATETKSKVPVVEGGQVFIPLNDAEAGVLNSYVYEAEISGAAKAPAEAQAPGQAIYWDAGNARFTTTAGANVLCGFVLQPSLAADTTITGLVAFNSFAAA